jgi:hypothetical protein
MTAIQVSPLTADDYAAWLPLWSGYQLFYRVNLAQRVTATTWARMLDPTDPVVGALAWEGDQAVGLVHTVTHRKHLDGRRNLLPQRSFRDARAADEGRRSQADRIRLCPGDHRGLPDGLLAHA